MQVKFEHIQRCVEGHKILKCERVFFPELGLPNHSEVHLHLDNGVTIALTSVGVQFMNVPPGEVEDDRILKSGLSLKNPVDLTKVF